MITIVDYGTSNLGSMKNMFKKIGVDTRFATSPSHIEDATKIIVPGVGSFDAGMRALNNSGMVPVLNRKALEERVPILGVCLGMQLMTRGSEEGDLPGLGWIAAQTVRFDQASNPGLRVPHMGWNEVKMCKNNSIVADMAEETRFYFAHSYHISCDNPADVLLECAYGRPFPAAIASGNLVAAQFHPEKSHRFGMWLLRNFAEIQ
ncbi:MAG: imidazole glycerol phosphate synthase subunit HisH [Allorhizobium sp.]